ncbi:hypothetical protein BDR03DRAFT_987567 [Suillus americanus]|nr:hypothetical protein BDR03DRAFT_987567 [Suillus americanus]
MNRVLVYGDCVTRIKGLGMVKRGLGDCVTWFRIENDVENSVETQTPTHQRASDERWSTGKAMVDEMVMTEVFADVEHDLGEIGGDHGVDESMPDTSDKQRNNSRKHQTHVQVEARNTTLQIIGLLGIFFHSTGVPQKVIDVLAHVGLSISVTSIHNAVHLMSKEIAANIKQGVNNPEALHCSAALWAADSCNPAPSTTAVEIDEFDMLQHHINDTYNKLGEPESVLQIPVTKTDQIPFHSMRIKQSTADGNMEVMENLL